MNIAAKLEENVLTLSIGIVPEDYAATYKERMRTERKQMKLKGFRPGQVPISVAEKMFGDRVRLDSVMRVFDSAISEYMQENNYSTFTQVLLDSEPNQEYQSEGNFSYVVSCGVIPAFTLDENLEMTVTNVKIDDEFLQKEVERRLNDYGDVQECDEVIPGEIVLVKIEELAEGGILAEEGYVRENHMIFLEHVAEDKRDLLVGKKAGDELVVEDMKAFLSNERALATILSDNEELYSKSFRLTVQQPKQTVAATEDAAFYAKFMQPAEGEEALPTDVSELRERLRSQLEEEQGFYTRSISNAVLAQRLVEDWDFNVNHEFLKRAFEDTELETEEQFEELTMSIRRFALDVVLRPEDPKELETFVEEKDQSRVLMDFTRQTMIARGMGAVANNAHFLQMLAQRILGEEEGVREFNQVFTHFAIMRRAVSMIKTVEVELNASDSDENTQLVYFADRAEEAKKSGAKKAASAEGEEKPKRATRKKKTEGAEDEDEKKPAAKKRTSAKKKDEE